METNNENKNILSEPELRFREELKNCVKRIVDAADAKRANVIVAVHVGAKTINTDAPQGRLFRRPLDRA